MKETEKELRVIIGADQTAVYANPRLPKPQLVGHLFTFPTDAETVKLWDTFSVEEQNALVQRAAEAKKDIRLMIRKTAEVREHRDS